MNIFKLLGEIAINNQGANHAIEDTNSRAHSLGENMGKVFTAVGNGAIKCGKVIGTGLAAGATAMTGLVVKGMSLLSDLEQNLGGSEAVFGEFSKRMQDAAAQAYKNMGLSQSDYLATANKMGSLLKGSGFATVEAVELTEEVMQRAADVASIMGIDIEHAMESIAGAAKGNFTMMDNLGVAINETNLKEYALSKGIRKATKDMSTQEKVALAMEMFMEKTAYAAGNYAKENDTLSGSLTTAKAAFKNFLSGAGDADQLADALENAANVIGKKLNVLLPKLSQGMGSLIKKLSPRIPALMQELLPGVIDGAVSLLNGLASALPDLLNVVAEVLPDAVSRIWECIKKTAPVLLKAVKSIIDKIDFTQIGKAIGDGVAYVIQNLPAILTEIGKALEYSWKTIVWPMIKGFALSFGDPLAGAILEEWDKVKPGLEKALSLIIGVDVEFPKAGILHDKFQNWIAEIAHLPEADYIRIGDKTASQLYEEYKKAKESGLGIGASNDKKGGTNWDEVEVYVKGSSGVGAGFGGAENGGGNSNGVGAGGRRSGNDQTENEDNNNFVGQNPSWDFFNFAGGWANQSNTAAFNGLYAREYGIENALTQFNTGTSSDLSQIISLLSAILSVLGRPLSIDTRALSFQINTQLGREYAQRKVVL